MIRLLHYADVENAYDDPERVGRLAGAIESLGDDATFVVGSGDNTGPGAVALATEGEQALAFFEAVRPDAEVLGNHDLDHGPGRARELISASPQPWLAANVRDGEDRFGADVGVRGSVVCERDGPSVAMIGVTDPETPSMCPPAEGLTFTDPIDAVERELSGLDADVSVVLSHVGHGDAAIARSCDVDAVLGGHVHEARVEWIDGTVCTRPGANGGTLLEVELDDGQVTRHDVADAPIDEAVAADIEAHLREEGLDEVVATVEEPMDRSRATLRDGETRIGNVVADAYRLAMDADVGLQNTPGLRTGPPLSGGVTKAELIGLVPFDAEVVLAEVSGRRLERIFAQAEGERMPGLGNYWQAQVSGATVTRGEPVAVAVGDEPVDPDETYRLATTEFLCRTDAEFPALRERDVGERGDIQHEVLLEYVRSHGIEAAIEGRIG